MQQWLSIKFGAADRKPTGLTGTRCWSLNGLTLFLPHSSSQSWAESSKSRAGERAAVGLTVRSLGSLSRFWTGATQSRVFTPSAVYQLGPVSSGVCEPGAVFPLPQCGFLGRLKVLLGVAGTRRSLRLEGQLTAHRSTCLFSLLALKRSANKNYWSSTGLKPRSSDNGSLRNRVWMCVQSAGGPGLIWCVVVPQRYSSRLIPLLALLPGNGEWAERCEAVPDRAGQQHINRVQRKTNINVMCSASRLQRNARRLPVHHSMHI